jgi:asparagine synthase (glutamine-hydrolysing)
MCGIFGWVSNTPPEQAVIDSALKTLNNRGPDTNGSWTGKIKQQFLTLGHTRLSILDLSSAANQPMTDPGKRFYLTYNGELYNYRELRKELQKEGCSFQTSSDTEVILQAWIKWGESCLQKFNGMFAFGIFDREKEELFIARDPVGIKPLYFSCQPEEFMFASELKTILANPAFQKKISHSGLRLFLQYRFIPSSHTILDDVFKLLPGHLLKWKNGAYSISQYSDLHIGTKNNNKHEYNNDAQILENLDSILRSAIKRQLVADVPVGCFLSGGIDSSLVAAIMSQMSTEPIKTFTIGFREPGYNEAEYAARVAKHLGTDHTELYLDCATAKNTVYDLYDFYDEPFADSCAIPMILLSRLTRERVKVALSGDGGDEFFCGYRRHIWAESLHKISSRIPFANFSSHYLQKTNSRLLQKAGAFLANKSPKEQYIATFNKWPANLLDKLLVNNTPLPEIAEKYFLNEGCITKNIMDADFHLYLPDDVLVKTDRATMGASLEARVPLLDLELIRFAAVIPLKYNKKSGQGKLLLKKTLKKYLPAELFNRPKKGFDVPVKEWLNGELKEYLGDHLSSSALNKHSLFCRNTTEAMLNDFFAGKFDYSEQLWTLLMFQCWYDKYI